MVASSQSAEALRETLQSFTYTVNGNDTVRFVEGALEQIKVATKSVLMQGQ